MIILPIRRNGHNIGEFHLHEITRLLSKKTLRPTDEVLMASGQWVSLEDYAQELDVFSDPDAQQEQEDKASTRFRGGLFSGFLDDIRDFGYAILFIFACLMVICLVGILIVVFNR